MIQAPNLAISNVVKVNIGVKLYLNVSLHVKIV